jgi:D-psicose/D-tagatose/L-ribulose 3-epimerase
VPARLPAHITSGDRPVIRYGAHCYILTERWTDESLPLLDRARALGLDCFEIAIGDDVHFSPAPVRRHAEALGLELTASPGGLWPAECDLSSDDAAERALGLAWHCRQVDAAAGMGATAYAGALYGHPGTVRRRVPPACELPRAAEGLHRLAEYAAGRGVAVVLEPMSHFRTHLINTPEEVARLIDMAAHPNLYALLDTYHMVTEVRDYAAGIRAVGGRLWGLHACENDRGVPGGGLVPWDAVFAALRQIGFDGHVLLEAYNSSLGDFAHRRGMFHNVCPDGEAFIRRGIAFVRRGLEGGD